MKKLNFHPGTFCFYETNFEKLSALSVYSTSLDQWVVTTQSFISYHYISLPLTMYVYGMVAF